ncbi:MAG TPA: hypothetical protein VJP89_10955 [Pyrinomonadaceae bacterium]|nr:hypothetical protein [Pyrinomonadaceae bacterium]
MRLLTLLLLVGLAITRVCAQTPSPVDPKIVFKVSLASSQREFHMGETIPLQLSFSSSVKDRYQINMAQYDRSGRMNYEQFVVSPAQGAVDPLPDRLSFMGGLTTHKFLSTEPWTIKLNLNEWVRFTQPGEYRLSVISNRVVVRDPANSFGGSPVAARSNEITLKIVAADPVWQKQVFSDAVTILDKPAPTKPEQREQHATARRQAMETLRFLGTADAAREMVKRMRGEESGGLDFICMLGLISTPEPAAARSALEEALADPDHPIDGTFFYTLRMVNSEPGNSYAIWRESQQRALEQLVAALSTKRGKALSISLNTAVNQDWNSTSLPKETTDKLVNQLVSMFDQLPLNEQNSLLTYRWNNIGGPAMLPILKRYAQSYRDFPQMRESNAYDARQLSASALKCWYELDPAGARPDVIKEISRPRPRFDARVLGILPDETLPEVDFTLAQNFVASDDLDGSSHLASLIARYATAAVLPQIVEKLDPNIGKLACAVQNPTLAYLLRVDPAIARPRIERAIAARGEGFSACNHDLFQIVSELHYDPILEEIAIRSLDDPDPQVASTAATMLGKFASPAAESALWQRYTSWNAKWAGRESQLDLMFADRVDERVYQSNFGQNLAKALATGKSWVADKNKLQRLLQMTKVRQIQQEVESYLKNWQDETINIAIDTKSLPTPFHARLAQYECHSMNDLKDKITQFPSGTKFALYIQPQQSSADDQSLTELRAFLTARKMLIAEQKSAP